MQRQLFYGRMMPSRWLSHCGHLFLTAGWMFQRYITRDAVSDETPTGDDFVSAASLILVKGETRVTAVITVALKFYRARWLG
ncbi:hypothetical protein PoB_003639200 [Plakobranchus ocellatus]|uniref:Uncharacterized protein n=1 Tax=Plakobranchus ocellatus TaxID=259542 RepID=A0AAV4ASI3_9GAST|nr:hypothetical protein PoB_003639200 [Plakobranchus ocellatus]